MSQEISHAFAHPEERAKASACDPFLDRISLRDHIVSVEIGAFQAERNMTQRLSFNIVVEVRQTSAKLGDDVDLILSYDRVTEAIDIELASERLNLLETLAERVADRILSEPQAERVFVRIEKLDRGGGALGVEIVRSGDDMQSTARKGEFQAARVLYISNEAAASGNLAGWVEQFTALAESLVLCVPPAGDDAIKTGANLAQNRIDLLAIEQNAWALGAKLERGEVVGTRTELDWALKNDQVSIWAPSKFIFDAVDAPMDKIGDPVGLAFWLAGEIGAREVVLIGASAREHAQIPSRAIAVTQERI